jgi:NAD-dependent SIR2 family protein deacetylase
MIEAALHAAELLEQADSLVIAAGAGMGVDSGLPDFRGNDGFWNAYPALARASLNFSEVASPRTFQTDARLAWGFYGHRLALYRATVPHEGFSILRRWAQRMPHGAFVFTSNVDGQFQKAGFSEDRIHECHGSIHAVQCLKPCCGDVWPAASIEPNVDLDSCRWLGEVPTCRLCGALLRPNVLMFSDGQWLDWRAGQQRGLLDAWLSKVRRPLVIELGAGTHIPSVRYFGNEVMRHHGGRLIRLNPRDADVPSSLDVAIRVGALAGLQAIDAALESLAL